MTHPLGVGFSVAVGIIALALTFLALLAWRRADNRRLLFVAAAFATFTVKAVVVVIGSDGVSWLGHDATEILASGLDLAVVVLLVFPFLLR